jgi:hypothetical protein
VLNPADPIGKQRAALRLLPRLVTLIEEAIKDRDWRQEQTIRALQAREDMIVAERQKVEGLSARIRELELIAEAARKFVEQGVEALILDSAETPTPEFDALVVALSEQTKPVTPLNVDPYEFHESDE